MTPMTLNSRGEEEKAGRERGEWGGRQCALTIPNTSEIYPLAFREWNSFNKHESNTRLRNVDSFSDERLF